MKARSRLACAKVNSTLMGRAFFFFSQFVFGANSLHNEPWPSAGGGHGDATRSGSSRIYVG